MPTVQIPVQEKKLGLALSGGGFRASFYHIGVLARMAEQGLLRHVEVISTVSGGSIIGALYYLHVKNLLDNRPDAAITNQDYVALVEDIERNFKQATDKNIRMSTFADFWSNLRFRQADYSRSDRISVLYNDLIYQKILQGVSNPVRMRELKIFPGGPGTSFDPRTGNAKRQAKVPILVINATSLNTGRAWQFTAQSMGEPIAHDQNGNPVYDETDSKPIRLRWARPSYDSIVGHQQNFALGHAVGASACVPALFPPLSVSGLYEDGNQDIRVQLVDGGVFDNQGIESLQYEECTHYVISDASGQLGVEYQPHTEGFKVLWRGFDSLFPDRVRAESLQKLFAAKGRGNIAFMHLRKGLGVREIPWIGVGGIPAGHANSTPATTRNYGVSEEVQERLSKIRTDLDAFNEVEAFSLMLDGYLISEQPLADLTATAFPSGKAGGPHAGAWRFKAIAPWINNPNLDYLRQLEVANYLFGKALFLIPALSALAVGAVLLLLVLLWPYVQALLETSIPTIGIAIILLAILADKLAKRLETIFKPFRILRSPVEAIYRLLLVAIPAAFIATPFVNLYLWLVNPLFLWRGRVENLGLSRIELLNQFWKWAKTGFKNNP
ncbi:MAG: patatin-like phospholipase family protein [Methylococcales bacterium]